MPENEILSLPCYCSSLRQAARALTCLYDAALAPAKLKVTQYALLSKMRRIGPTDLHTLSQATSLERTTLVRNLDILGRKGLMRSSLAESSRAHILTLTEKGLAALDEARPLWEQTHNKVQGLFTASEQALLCDLLGRLKNLD